MGIGLLIGLAAAGGMAAGGAFSKKSSPEMPKSEAALPTKTAEPLEQLSEAGKKSRQRAASMVTKEWSEPKLGSPGLLGQSGSQGGNL